MIKIIYSESIWIQGVRSFRLGLSGKRGRPNRFSGPIIPSRRDLRHVFFPRHGLCSLGLTPVQPSIDGGANRNEGARAIVRKGNFHVAGASARRTAVSSSSSSKGLVRNAEAPAFNAVERTSGSSFPVKMMTRVEGESSLSLDWTSNPLIIGIQTSITATGARWILAYSRNLSGSLNCCACQPADESKRPTAFSTDGSSSSRQITLVIRFGKASQDYTRLPPNDYETLVSYRAAGATPAFSTKRTSSATEETLNFCIIRPR